MEGTCLCVMWCTIPRAERVTKITSYPIWVSPQLRLDLRLLLPELVALAFDIVLSLKALRTRRH